MEDQEIVKEIQEIIDSQINEIKIEYYVAIRDVYKNAYRILEFQNIKYIICRCIVLGFYIPAMTLLNHFLEKFLKFTLIYHDNKKNGVIDKDNPFQLVDELALSNPKYNNKNLNDNIIEAYNQKLIDEAEKLQLLKMKDEYRNAYSHADTRTMYGEATVGITVMNGMDDIMKLFEGKEEELPKRQEKLVNLNFADFKFINDFAEKDCVPYLIDLDCIIRNVEKKLIN